MHTWIEQFKVAIRKAKSPRDRLLVALAFAFPNRTLEDLAQLRVEDIRVKNHSMAHGVIIRLLESLPKQGLAFVSRKGRGSSPASRITLWRILKQFVGSGISVIRRLVAGSTPTKSPQPVPVVARHTPRPITSLSDYYASRKPGD